MKEIPCEHVLKHRADVNNSLLQKQHISAISEYFSTSQNSVCQDAEEQIHFQNDLHKKTKMQKKQSVFHKDETPTI